MVRKEGEKKKMKGRNGGGRKERWKEGREERRKEGRKEGKRNFDNED